MRITPDLSVHWFPRAQPLEPVAVAAAGDAARKLAERLWAGTDERLDALSGVASPDWMVLLGDAASLPWVDGVTYLGRDPGAPRLLLPTLLQPNVRPELLERALLRLARASTEGAGAGTGTGTCGTVAPPLAVLPAQRAVIPLGSARTVSRSTLAATFGLIAPVQAPAAREVGP